MGWGEGWGQAWRCSALTRLALAACSVRAVTSCTDVASPLFPESI